MNINHNQGKEFLFCFFLNISCENWVKLNVIWNLLIVFLYCWNQRTLDLLPWRIYSTASMSYSWGRFFRLILNLWPFLSNPPLLGWETLYCNIIHILIIIIICDTQTKCSPLWEGFLPHWSPNTNGVIEPVFSTLISTVFSWGQAVLNQLFLLS